MLAVVATNAVSDFFTTPCTHTSPVSHVQCDVLSFETQRPCPEHSFASPPGQEMLQSAPVLEGQDYSVSVAARGC